MRPSRRVLSRVVCATLMLAITAASRGSASSDWPPFLRASDEYPEDVADTVARLWVEPTFTRTVSAEPAPVPLSFYLKFVDAPDVTAAAARHLGLTTYEVKVVGNDGYTVTDGNRTHGAYHVLAREGGRRIMLSSGTHRSGIIGTIGGSALTRLELGDEGGRTSQRLVVNVIVDHGLLAGVTRPLLSLFGPLVDRKLSEAFRTAAAAAVWAHQNRGEFCGWLNAGVASERRAELRDVFAECGVAKSAS